MSEESAPIALLVGLLHIGKIPNVILSISNILILLPKTKGRYRTSELDRNLY